jgi:threonine aldolase
MENSEQKVINLYSDTQTLPTPEMYEAMAKAPLGDDMMGLDPTVNELERVAAEITGKEAALMVTSGTMGNLAGLMALTSPGDEVILDPESHVWFYEAGAFCSVGGLTPRPVSNREGLLDPEDVISAIRPKNLHMPTPRVLSLENTHNRGQGRITPISLHRELCDAAHQKGLSVHLDGARIFNAQVATGVSVAEYAGTVDSITFCLSKGLSCPVGSILAGSRPFIEKARRIRKRLGGAMRQAGILAAAGIVALRTTIDRLAEDHSNARRLAEALAGLSGLSVDLKRVETNMVYVDVSGTDLTGQRLSELLKESGVMASVPGPSTLRFVTHRHITSSDIDKAVSRVRDVLEKIH